MKSSTLSISRILDPEEIEFCRNYIAAGERYGPESWRKAYNRTDLTAVEVGEKVKVLLVRKDINAYLDELREGHGETARRKLGEALIVGDRSQALKAAEKVLADEEKVGLRDSVERFWDILCQAGAEVVVPLPGKCGNCGTPYEASTSFKSFFPDRTKKKSDIVPPPIGPDGQPMKRPRGRPRKIRPTDPPLVSA